MAKGKRKKGRSVNKKSPHRQAYLEERWEWVSSPDIQPIGKRYILAVAKSVLGACLVFGAVYKISTYLDQPEVVSSGSMAKSEKAIREANTLHKHEPMHTAAKKGKPADQGTLTPVDGVDKSKATLIGETAFVSSNDALIRETPKTDAKVLGKAVFGTSIDVVKHDGKWVQIHSSAQSISGWVEKVSLNF